MSWKTSLYLLGFGILALVAVLFRPQPQREFTTAEVLGASTNLTLFVEPDDGRQPLLDIINSAHKEILLTVYLLSDPDVELYLAEAKKRGVEVKVLLEEHPFGGAGLNPKAKEVLEKAGAEVRWANPSFTLTHEKTIVVDGRIVCILTMNLSKTAFSKNREYNTCDQNPGEVTEAKMIFEADWERKGYLPGQPNLVVSPENSRGKLTAFIKSATKSLDVEVEVLEDQRIIDLLAQKATEIPVRIILPPVSKVDTNKKALDKLKAKILSSPYIHAKLIVVDGERAYLGSVNLSSQSLDQNRELGILIAQSDIMERINQVFNQDWENGQN